MERRIVRFDDFSDISLLPSKVGNPELRAQLRQLQVLVTQPLALEHDSLERSLELVDVDGVFAELDDLFGAFIASLFDPLLELLSEC